jgi:hypothetical protein
VRQTPLASASGLTEHLTETEIKKLKKSFKGVFEKNRMWSIFGKKYLSAALSDENKYRDKFLGAPGR